MNRMREGVAGVLALALALATASCAHAPGAGRGQIFALDQGQAGRLASGGRIVFANVVNDSRCPRGVTCVWAGTATARFQLVPDPSRRDTVSVLAVLSGGAGRDDAAAQLPVDTLGSRITLLELTPYPVAGGERNGERPRAVVRVAPIP